MCGIVGIVQKDSCFTELYDSLIKLQHRGQDAAGITEHDISLKNISDGMYTLQIKTDTEIHSERLIVKND